MIRTRLPTAPAGISAPPVPSALLSAAVAGLVLGALPACSTEGHNCKVAPDAGNPYVVDSIVSDEEMTFAKFSKLCEERSGFIQTHAACVGNNSCKGISYNNFNLTLSEHTCKGLNSCSGMSCVVPATDEGRTGEEVYKVTCSECHGAPNFTYYVPPGTDLDAAEANFLKRPKKAQVTRVAFGVTGINENGTAAANMPAHFTRYSRGEIERAVDHVRTLNIIAEEYGIVGVTDVAGTGGTGGAGGGGAGGGGVGTGAGGAGGSGSGK